MSQRVLIIIALLFLASETVKADTKGPKTIPEYCSIVESHILQLSEAEATSNSNMAKYAVDQQTANAKKFLEARQLLESFSASLKENEEEWYRLGCSEILYSHSSK